MSNVTFGDGPFIEGSNYTGSDGRSYQLKNGCMVICAPVDIDTVDGYSAPGTAPAGVTDSVSGDPIVEGAPVVVFYGPDGEITGYKDCTDMDTNDFGVLQTASTDFVDSSGNAVSAGDNFILLADGTTTCTKKTIDTDTDTFAGLIVAGADGVDDAGNAYAAGDALIELVGGQIVCAAKTIDTDTVDGFAVQGVADGSQLDAEGNAIPAGAEIILFYDASGELLNAKDCTDDNTFGVLLTATEAFTDSAGNEVAVDDQYTLLADGSTVCAEKAIDTDTQDGYSLLGFSDGTQLDQEGAPIAEGAEVINYYDETGTYLYSKDCTDNDTFGVPSVAEEAGEAINGPYAPGQTVLTFPGGLVVCVPEKIVDTFGTVTENVIAPDTLTQTNPDGTSLTICSIQYKGLRDNEDGTFTEVLLNQDGEIIDGANFQYVQDTDQRLTNPVITQETVDGVTTHTVTWDIVDIDGNVVGQESASGITMPVFVDKTGNVLSGPIAPLLAEQFGAGSYTVGTDKLMVLSDDGTCKLVDRTCCVQKCKITPEGIKILEVSTTEGELVGYFSEAGNAFTDDPAILVDCPEPANLVDCEDNALTSESPDVSVRQHGEFNSMVTLPTIPCPDNCTPPDAPCVKEGFIQPDEFGGIWEKAPGAAVDAWVRTRKAQCNSVQYGRLRSLDEAGAQLDIGADTPNGMVLGSVDVVLENKTCDPMRFKIEISPHGEVRGPGWPGAGVAFIGYEVDVSGVGVLHHTAGLYGGTANTEGNEQLYLDHSGEYIWRNQMNPLVPAKSSITVPIEMSVRKNLYTDPANRMVAAEIGWRVTGLVECD